MSWQNIKMKIKDSIDFEKQMKLYVTLSNRDDWVMYSISVSIERWGEGNPEIKEFDYYVVVASFNHEATKNGKKLDKFNTYLEKNILKIIKASCE